MKTKDTCEKCSEITCEIRKICEDNEMEENKK
jgi:hypothetical protein